jgi:hypothetical protein
MSGTTFAQPPAPVRPTEALVDQVPPKPFGQPTMAKADYETFWTPPANGAKAVQRRPLLR